MKKYCLFDLKKKSVHPSSHLLYVERDVELVVLLLSHSSLGGEGEGGAGGGGGGSVAYLCGTRRWLLPGASAFGRLKCRCLLHLFTPRDQRLRCESFGCFVFFLYRASEAVGFHQQQKIQ